MNNVLLQKTHYEVFVTFFREQLGIDIKELCRLFKNLYGNEYTFKNFQLFLYKQFPSFNNLKENEIVNHTNILFHLCMMELHHSRIYYITPTFSSKLVNTNLNVDSHFLKSPFNEIFIQVDPNLFSIIDIYTMNKVGVNGFYIHFLEKKDGIKEIRIMAATMLKSTEILPLNDSVFYFRLEILPNGKIKKIVSDYLKNQVIWNQYELKKFQGDLNVNVIEEITYFVFNTLLYITSKEPDIIEQLPKNSTNEISQKKNKAKIRKAQKRSEKCANLPVLIVGSNVVDKLKDLESIKECGSIFKWKLKKRLYVEGYWRVQWYGSEKNNTKESKVIFIEPYYKGPQISDILHRTYLIGK